MRAIAPPMIDGSTRVWSCTCRPVARISQLQQGLMRATGRQVQLQTRVDPSIIGGAIARIGSTVYDGSVTTQLTKVKERLTAAAAE